MKISIITTTFNSGATVEDTFKSILAQTFKDIEYLVVDGGSTDNTLELIKEYEGLFEGKMRWISEKDRGVYDAMNKGVRMATGEVVGFLNSDDYYTSDDCLQCVVETFEKSDIEATYGNVHYVSAKTPDKMVRFYCSKHFRPSLMRLGFMPAHPSFYCKRWVFEKYGLFDTGYRIASDFELLLRFLFVNKIRAHYIAKDFVTMRTGGLSTSGLKSHRQIMKDHRKALKANHVYSNFFILCLRYIYKIYELVRAQIAAFFCRMSRRVSKK